MAGCQNFLTNPFRSNPLHQRYYRRMERLYSQLRNCPGKLNLIFLAKDDQCLWPVVFTSNALRFLSDLFRLNLTESMTD